MNARRERRLLRVVVAILLSASGRRVALAQECTTIVTRTAPPGIENAFVRTVTVRTDKPITLPIAGGWLSALRRRTETSVVQRQLLFEAGQRLDSARVAETLRRLRDQRLYSDIVLTVNRCAGGDSVDLTVATQDAWTLRPIARITPPSTVSLGVEDRNLLGTGRSISVSNDQTTRGHGGTFATTDPWLFGAPAIGAFRFSDVGGAHLLRASLRNHELSLFDPWHVDVAVGRQSFAESSSIEKPTNTFFLVGLVGHIIGSSETAATTLYGGGSEDQGRFLSILRGDDGVAKNHRRDYQSIDIGVMRRTAQFDTVSWFAQGRGFLDIPIGVQTDVLMGFGKDQTQDADALYYDAWAGRFWIPKRGELYSLDAWSSGYVGDVRANHIDRISAASYVEAPRGFWTSRVLFEQLLQLDPDLRTLSLANIGTDPTFAAVPGDMRLADRALASTIERSMHIRPFARASMLDGSLFAAGSVRWDSPAHTNERLAVAVVGARLRFFSANGSFGSTRVDVAFPVAANGGSVVHRPLFSVSLTSLLDAPRMRDGRRRQQ